MNYTVKETIYQVHKLIIIIDVYKTLTQVAAERNPGQSISCI